MTLTQEHELQLSGQKRILLDLKDPASHPIEGFGLFYSALYATGEKEDSPEESRQSLRERVRRSVAVLGDNGMILHVGAGRQILEEEETDPNIKARIVTVDIAKLERHQLLTKDVTHFQGNGCELPFADNTFPMVISNLAADLMPQGIYAELLRVAQPGGKVLLNLHHPSLGLDEGEEAELYRISKRIKFDKRYGRIPRVQDQLSEMALKFRKGHANQRLFFKSEEEIRHFFEQEGFTVETIGEESGKYSNKWWRADLRKP